MNRNTGALKILALVGAWLAYVGAVVYGDIMFLQTVHIAFPAEGIFGSLAVAGALVTAVSAIILPIALHWWFAPGLQFVWGVIFWGLDIAALALNSMLAFQAAAGFGLDPFIETWRTWSPATPMLAVIGWGIAFLLDPSHKMRHAQAELEADQIDAYATRMRAAVKSPEIDDVILEAARQAALDYAQQLHGAHLPAKPKALPNGRKPEPAPLDLDGVSKADQVKLQEMARRLREEAEAELRTGGKGAEGSGGPKGGKKA